MKGHIMDWQLIKIGLMLMLKGMVAIFIVMLIIYLFVIILAKTSKSNKKE